MFLGNYLKGVSNRRSKPLLTTRTVLSPIYYTLVFSLIEKGI